jgi:hypothetical protein
VRAPGARGLLLLRAGVRGGAVIVGCQKSTFAPLDSRLAQSGAMADTSEECQGVGNFNAHLKARVAKCSS